jgi:hypothetical protein
VVNIVCLLHLVTQRCSNLCKWLTKLLRHTTLSLSDDDIQSIKMYLRHEDVYLYISKEFWRSTVSHLLCFLKNRTWSLMGIFCDNFNIIYFVEHTYLHITDFSLYANISVTFRLQHSFTWRSWIRASWYNYENNQQDALYRLIYYSKPAVHVSGDVFVHHQEHLTVFTVSGSIYPSCCRHQPVVFT